MAPTHSPAPATLPKPRPAPADHAGPLAAWLAAVNALLTAAAAATGPVSEEALAAVFLADGYWRDHLCLSWEYRTAHTLPRIGALLAPSRIRSIELSPSHANPSFVAPLDFEGQLPAVYAFIAVTTTVGTGHGMVRLLQDDGGDGSLKAYTVFTALKTLDRYPERVFKNRPNGVAHGTHQARKNWAELRRDELEMSDPQLQPAVLIIGAGHVGLVTAARLKMLGIPALVIDRNERIGDNWRKRYHQLVLHDPVHYDHLPYLPFPPGWPTFAPKDKLADWLEFYASALELNVWTSSTISAASFDEQTRSWSVTVARPSGPRQLQPRHVVLATGHSGEPHMPAGLDLSPFAGDVICHSSAFCGAKRLTAGQRRKAVVVGCCNSAHDIAQSYFENGYDVTMVQRSSTYVMGSANGMDVLMEGTYNEDGPPLEDADVLFMSNPIALFKRNQIGATEEIARRDKDMLAGLAKAGFTLDKGPHGSGLLMKYFETGGGYYIDVGASALIASGDVKIKKIQQIVRIVENGIEFDQASGSLEADEIVFATGYGNMLTTAKRILGHDALQGVGEVWGIDSDSGEFRGMWNEARPGLGLYFVGGNLALSRWYSRSLALAIAAREGGLL